VAAPVLGDLSDRYGRRPILIVSLAGTALSFVMLALASSLPMLFLARIVDGLSGGNIATARAYVADVTAPEDRARAYGLIGAAFGLGFIVGPALSAVLSRVSYTAPIWAAAGITVVAMVMAWGWLPETARRVSAGTGMPFRSLAEMLRRPRLRRILVIDFGYWCAFAVFQATFALIGARRFGFDASQTGGFFAAFAVLGALIQVTLIRSVVARLGDKWAFMTGMMFAAIGLVGATLAPAAPAFALALVPLSIGLALGHPTLSSLVSRAARTDEQGRVHGAASVMESLGRTVGPVWGAASLQRVGDAMPYASAAGLLLAVMALSAGYQAGERDSAGTLSGPV
jgi:DHA1 family tetracycline resistance protein-like MFS transporter